MTPHDATLDFFSLRILARVGEHYGVERSDFLRLIPRHKKRLHVSEMKGLIDALIARSGAADIPLQIGAAMRLNDIGPMGDTLRCAHTIHEALLILTKYHTLVHTAISPIIAIHPETVSITLQYQNPAVIAVRYPAEGFLSAYLGLLGELAGEPLCPLRVDFYHEAGAPESCYREVFSVTPHFQAEENRLVFDAAVLALPIPTSDERLKAFHLGLLRADLNDLQDPPLSHRLQFYLSQNLIPTPPSLKACAEHFMMAPRTLQHHLALEKRTFKECLNTMRMEKAKVLLGRGERVGMTGFLLGFQNHPAFSRMFKQYSGMMPREYQLKIQADSCSVRDKNKEK